MEIERKYLIPSLPDLTLASDVKVLEQGYISTSPVIRIRRANDRFILTCKGKGLVAREEFELTLEEAEYLSLQAKVDNHLISKKRYLIPYMEHMIELDVFEGHLKGLVMAEEEFPSMEAGATFTPPSWFGTDVSLDNRFQNSHLSTLEDLSTLRDKL